MRKGARRWNFLTQLDPAEYTCLVYLSVLLCALAKKHNWKLRSTRNNNMRKPTCAHRRKSILVANESCIFPFGAAALGMLGNRLLSNKKPRFRQVLTPGFARQSSDTGPYMLLSTEGDMSPFCFDVSLPSLAVVMTLEIQTEVEKRNLAPSVFNGLRLTETFFTGRKKKSRYLQTRASKCSILQFSDF